ncbi:unnamed protein product [Chondrus crispus]|uniref:Uncharacterized protein n=1 Tax=Chondrus crispus TaxID=2769 RepID=R7Q4R5_CHOCR|nr:unnamed protein product [Chondrus crispus]CDF32371.1 unnamed protein product [Chondrus crispus]|eukprot:XP_005712036.1 unnamed protein product [Chondrus crispus]
MLSVLFLASASLTRSFATCLESSPLSKPARATFTAVPSSTKSHRPSHARMTNSSMSPSTTSLTSGFEMTTDFKQWSPNARETLRIPDTLFAKMKPPARSTLRASLSSTGRWSVERRIGRPALLRTARASPQLAVVRTLPTRGTLRRKQVTAVAPVWQHFLVLSMASILRYAVSKARAGLSTRLLRGWAAGAGQSSESVSYGGDEQSDATSSSARWCSFSGADGGSSSSRNRACRCERHRLAARDPPWPSYRPRKTAGKEW